MVARIGRKQRGFTLIELMIVVALIAVLAAIVIPSFFAESSRAKAESEISSIFAELRTKEEGYKVERGVYLATGTAETSLFPAGPLSDVPQVMQGALPAAWVTLRFAPPQPKALCGYVVLAGPAGDPAGEIGAMASGTFGMDPNPVTAWFYILAHCNLDGNATKDTYAFTSSMNAQIQWLNPGH